MSKPYYMRHADDELFDEIRIRVVPRLKTSGLSGDEWRISALTEFLRKGVVVYSESTAKMEWAVAKLGALWLIVPENLLADQFHTGDDLCQQPGCSEPAVSEYRLKREGCGRCGQYHETPGEYRIRFCARHLYRGDCDLTDSDENYEVVSGPGPEGADGCLDDVSPSAQVVVDLRTPE